MGRCAAARSSWGADLQLEALTSINHHERGCGQGVARRRGVQLVFSEGHDELVRAWRGRPQRLIRLSLQLSQHRKQPLLRLLDHARRRQPTLGCNGHIERPVLLWPVLNCRAQDAVRGLDLGHTLLPAFERARRRTRRISCERCARLRRLRRLGVSEIGFQGRVRLRLETVELRLAVQDHTPTRRVNMLDDGTAEGGQFAPRHRTCAPQVAIRARQRVQPCPCLVEHLCARERVVVRDDLGQGGVIVRSLSELLLGFHAQPQRLCLSEQGGRRPRRVEFDALAQLAERELWYRQCLAQRRVRRLHVVEDALATREFRRRRRVGVTVDDGSESGRLRTRRCGLRCGRRRRRRRRLLIHLRPFCPRDLRQPLLRRRPHRRQDLPSQRLVGGKLKRRELDLCTTGDVRRGGVPMRGKGRT